MNQHRNSMPSADFKMPSKILPQTEWAHQYDCAAFFRIQSFRQAPSVAIHIQHAWFRPGHDHGGDGGRKRECRNKHRPKNIPGDERRSDAGSAIVRRRDLIGMTQPLAQLGFKLVRDWPEVRKPFGSIRWLKIVRPFCDQRHYRTNEREPVYFGIRLHDYRILKGVGRSYPDFATTSWDSISAPARRRKASRYFAEVFSITSRGNFGAGGVLFQSRVSR